MATRKIRPGDDPGGGATSARGATSGCGATSGRGATSGPGVKPKAGSKPPADPADLRRQGAGLHTTGDGRFIVEQSANGWMVTDAERSNELGLPLVRGPFATLVAARQALTAARSGPLPISNLADRIAAIPKQGPRSTLPARGGGATIEPVPPSPPVVREFRSRDGDGLRSLWAATDVGAVAIDDMRLRKFAQRNPGTFIVVAQGDALIGAGLGGWDGRYGWLHLVTVAGDHRRIGLGTQLVRRIESGLEAVGCRRVRVIDEGRAADLGFWGATGYHRDSGGFLAREIGAGFSGAPDADGRTEPSGD